MHIVCIKVCMSAIFLKLLIRFGWGFRYMKEHFERRFEYMTYEDLMIFGDRQLTSSISNRK